MVKTCETDCCGYTFDTDAGFPTVSNSSSGKTSDVRLNGMWATARISKTSRVCEWYIARTKFVRFLWCLCVKFPIQICFSSIQLILPSTYIPLSTIRFFKMQLQSFFAVGLVAVTGVNSLSLSGVALTVVSSLKILPAFHAAHYSLSCSYLSHLSRVTNPLSHRLPFSPARL